MASRRVLFVLPIALSLIARTGAHGQNITGAIVGQVSDSSGSAIPGAAIAARNVDTGLLAQTTTDTSGSYSLPNLLSGVYEISARKPGFQIRADFLDAFNHFNLGSPSGTIVDTRDGGLPNPNSGKIFGGSGNRVIQLGLKYQF